MKEEYLFKLIQKKQEPFIKNISLKNNSKTIIAFSGVPGSGKTHLSKLLQKKYQAVRVRTDTVRDIINTFPENYFNKISVSLEETFNVKEKSKLKKFLYDDLSIKKEGLVSKYMDNFLRSYCYENTLIIYDGSVDRCYEKLKEISDNLGFRLFIIKLPFNKDIIRKRIIDRGEGDMTFFDTNLTRWKNDYNNLNKKIKTDFVFNNNIEELIEKTNEVTH